MWARRNHFAAGAGISRRGTVVIVQQAAQPLAAQHGSLMTRWAFIWQDQPVAEALVVSLAMIMQNELANPFAQRILNVAEDGFVA